MSAVPARVTLVTLGVADVGRATAFYELIGWRKLPSSQDTITFLRTAGPIVALYGWDELADDAQVAAAGSGFRGVTLAINLESPEAVDAAYSAWIDAGGTSVKAPVAVFWGGYSSYVADLDGHLWEIAHNPYLEMDADGLPVHPD